MKRCLLLWVFLTLLISSTVQAQDTTGTINLVVFYDGGNLNPLLGNAAGNLAWEPIYQQIDKIGYDNAYAADFAFATYDYVVLNKRIQGYVNSPSGGPSSETDNIYQWTLSN